MEKFKLYKIGGVIRDQLMGVKSKDIDYTFVFENIDPKITPQEYFAKMKDCLIQMGVTIWQERPDCYTIRGNNGSDDMDYVLARKESYPDPNSRIPVVEMGTLYDDQIRRDYNLNTIAEDDCGNLIDPFNGQEDIKNKILRCPIDAKTSFNDDPLRMLRALRFAITKGFKISDDINEVMTEDEVMWDKFDRVVSRERVREEIQKMFKYDTVSSMKLLVELDNFSDINILERIFKDDMWMEITNKKR